MKKYLLILFFGMSAGADPGPIGKTSAPATESASSKLWSVSFRSGLMLENPDTATISKWEHRPLESYKHAIGGRIAFPPKWVRFQFLGGAEFQYITAKQELSGAYTATIDTTITQFVAYGGGRIKPDWARGFGAEGTLGLKLAGQKKSKLDAEGFSQDLGDESPNGDNNFFLLWNIPLIASLNIFYDWGSFRPYLSLETDSALTLGGAYVF